MNVLNLVALKVKKFKAIYNQDTVYAQITEDKVLLLSQVSEFQMVAELVPIDRTQICQENKLAFTLEKPFTDDHQIKLMFADKQKGHAFFFTESFHLSNNGNNNSLIDSVHFLKIAVDAEGKMSVEQADLLLPEQ